MVRTCLATGSNIKQFKNIDTTMKKENTRKIAAAKSKSSDKKEMQGQVSDNKNYQKPRRVTDPEELEIINYLLQQDGADLSGEVW